MPKGFNLRCAAGKTARVWLQGKGGGLAPGQALVLLPVKMTAVGNCLMSVPISRPAPR
jgi:hypothetical protein